MLKSLSKIQHSLISKLIVSVGLMLLLSLATWAYMNTNYQKKKFMADIISNTDRLTNTVRLGAHYAMMLNSRDDINQIIQNISKQQEIENIRIYNKEGKIKFSNKTAEVESTTNIEAEACYICHRSEPPLSKVSLEQRTRIFHSPKGYRLLGIITPIRNEPGCATDACHVHPQGKKILGALDFVVSLKNTDKELRKAQRNMLGLSLFLFLLTSTIIFVFVLRFVNRPIQKLINETRRIAKGDYLSKVDVEHEDEMGQLAVAINEMTDKIAEKQIELNEQRDEYQALFERVPCLITVQDRNFKLLRYNQEFSERFAPEPNDFCFHAYKGRSEKCIPCPVEKTFEDGQLHFGEETGLNKDGRLTHWIVRTSPIKNSKGEIIAAMEMSLDITERKQLEEQLRESEKKYHEIFNNMPNPVFVLDMDSLKILDCNASVKAVYGYNKMETLNLSFLDLFWQTERDKYASEIKKFAVINQVKHRTKEGKTVFVNIRVSPSTYPGKEVFLAMTSDITKRLETEQQLIQASKMATLGEMATGVAHELNQPLSVIKTASSFSIKKIEKHEPIGDEILFNILMKIDSNIDRATKIINHMRQFARKSDMDLEKVQLNDVLKRAFEIFSQQLKLRGIEVQWHIEKKLPKIYADPSRLEQVFINLLLNARDAIEEKWDYAKSAEGEKKIILKTMCDRQWVICEVCDTGKGVSDAIADKIFEPFFTTKEVGKGTGLGLSISYGIIKDCGGSIQVFPNEPEGACFVLKFPIPKKTNGNGKENITRR
jgi:histidine kinase